MSAPVWKALGERAVKCEAWRWLPGMLALHRHTSPVRVLGIESDEACALTVHPGEDGPEVRCAHEWGVVGLFREHDFVPDLSDPATLGCLLALVREAWRAPTVHVGPVGAVASGGAQWAVRIFSGECPYPFIQCQRATEAEALVAALEAAPESDEPEDRP